MNLDFCIDVTVCAESGRFVGTSDDIKGLVLEAETVGGLLDAARDVVPDLLLENSQATANDNVNITVSIHRMIGGIPPRSIGTPSPQYVVKDDADVVYA